MADSKPGSVIYRSEDGSTDFRFLIEAQADGTYRAYILDHPDYGSRSSDVHSTHRHIADCGCRYICWQPMPRTEAEMKAVTKLWSERTLRYIRTGKDFNVN